MSRAGLAVACISGLFSGSVTALSLAYLPQNDIILDSSLLRDGRILLLMHKCKRYTELPGSDFHHVITISEGFKFYGGKSFPFVNRLTFPIMAFENDIERVLFYCRSEKKFTDLELVNLKQFYEIIRKPYINDDQSAFLITRQLFFSQSYFWLLLTVKSLFLIPLTYLCLRSRIGWNGITAGFLMEVICNSMIKLVYDLRADSYAAKCIPDGKNIGIKTIKTLKTNAKICQSEPILEYLYPILRQDNNYFLRLKFLKSLKENS